MDRSAFAACALLLGPVVAGTGCGMKEEPPAASPAPLVLAELQSLSPGPWRADSRAIAPTSLEQAAPTTPGAAASLRNEVLELERRMRGPETGYSPEGQPIEPALQPVEAASPAVPVEVGLVPSSSPAPPAEAMSAEAPPRSRHEAGPAIVDPTPVKGDSPRAPVETSPAPRTLEEILAPPDFQNEGLSTEIAPLPEERGQLPWADAHAGSGQMPPVLEQAEQRIREGFRLADRQAVYLARSEFIAALELICQANDQRHGTQFYSRALVAGLNALDESHDFARARPTGKTVDVVRLASGHRSKILSTEECATISPLVAAKRYYSYAQEQLAGAAAGEARSSIALYGLARLAMAAGEVSPADRMEHDARAMVLHQAALMADRNNFRAANELGVLLARHGDYGSARTLLLHSVRLSPHPSTYRNLVAVHTRLGEAELAQQASQHAVALERAGMQRNGPQIAWVDPVTFAGTAPPTTATAMPPVAQPQSQSPAASSAAERPAAETAGTNKSEWFPWKTRR